MPKIAAYHPEIAVQKKDGSLVVIKPDMDDYYTDREVLDLLQEATDAGTVGEAVEAIEKRGMGNPPDGMLACRIENGDESYQLRHQWDDPI